MRTRTSSPVRRRRIPGRLLPAIVLLLAVTPVCAQPGGSSGAASPVVAQLQPSPTAPPAGARAATAVEVPMGTSVVLDVPGQLQRASVTNPDIANIQIIPPNQILINGKTPGITTVIAWSDAEVRYFDIVVKVNLSLLQQAIRELAPQEEIEVKSVQTSVVLSGTVANPSLMVRIGDLVRAFLPEKAPVVNLLRLAEPHQILLKVDVAEVNRAALRELGIDFINLGTTVAVAVFGATTAGLLSTILDKDGTVTFDNRTSIVFAHNPSRTRALIRAFEQRGLVKTLARPNLVAASGASASFLVGGEFPVPVPTAGIGGTLVTIQFKPFGVRLDFTPTLNDLGSINLKINPEVSELDFENGLEIAGFRIPALRSRRANTIVDLKPGHSLAIGGLISSEIRKTLTKFPLLGDIPVLGALFRSTSFVRNESDLIVLVTPEILKPLEPGQVPDVESYLRPLPEEIKELRQVPGLPVPAADRNDR